MGGFLVIADHLRGVVRDVTAELVTAASELGGPVVVVVLGSDPCGLAPACSLDGVDEIVEIAVPSDGMNGDLWVAALSALIGERQPEAVLCAHSVDGMGFAPTLAAAGGHGLATDVIAVRRDDEALVARRAPYGGKVVSDVDFPAALTVVLTLRPTTWAAAPAGGSPTRTAFVAPATTSRLRHRAYVEQERSDIDIAGADVLVSIGRGIGDRENIALFERVAARLGATLASSRPLVDAGWMAHARQVGQSGTTVKPAVYVAFGISGAVQHLAGIKAARTVIAVNTDPDAPIFAVAQYGAVADALAVAEALESL